MKNLLIPLLSAIAFAACAQETAAPPQVEILYQDFQSPTAIVSNEHAVYVSDWSADHIVRIAADGSRRILPVKIAAPAGLALAKDGTLYAASYSGDYILRIEADGRSERIAEGLATPTGIAFARSGELLIANQAAGEIVALNIETGKRRIAASGLSLPVGVTEAADGSLVASQYGGRVTRITTDGQPHEIGRSFTRPGVGIINDGTQAVLVADNGAGLVRRVSLDGKESRPVTPKLQGSLVALGRGLHGETLAGAWGSGTIYRLRQTESR
ncbi:serine/threonine protein kinase [Actinobacillus succinogenes]|uniref:Serine/threonine-protein kinase n=1 Tax=Actinobacillus succinogenes (strain ATCC 55618 / DSM 22257 / CCUG 43843 / 130Z) TaxID=339671 RepID=A6VR23_ACTSZ|nr:serine/threonine protein kinase [Actinobacillus succinogenes]ABR75420.1 serine/threonine-protein kinase [Actinobacillus succinogenes 130Z]PHI40192.1 serine/threonine protein kinase [Actinobacillus succinogenes]